MLIQLIYPTIHILCVKTTYAAPVVNGDLILQDTSLEQLLWQNCNREETGISVYSATIQVVFFLKNCSCNLFMALKVFWAWLEVCSLSPDNLLTPAPCSITPPQYLKLICYKTKNWRKWQFSSFVDAFLMNQSPQLVQYQGDKMLTLDYMYASWIPC